jgi:hypothetical protein
MNSIAIASISFACMFGGALLGGCLGKALPGDHLSSDSRDVVKLGAKGTFDSVNAGLTQPAANFSDLDRILD